MCVSPSVRRREDAKDIAFAVFVAYSTLYTIKYLYFPRRVCHLFSSRLVWKGHRENPRPVAYVLGKGRLLRILIVLVRVEVSERDGHARSGRPGPRDGRDGIAVDFMMPSSSSLEDPDFGRRREQRPRRRRRQRRDDDDHLVFVRGPSNTHQSEKSFPRETFLCGRRRRRRQKKSEIMSHVHLIV